VPIASLNDVDIAYEIDGSGPDLLLVMGIAGQLTDWHPGFVEGLAKHFRVIRFDNRDIGLSSRSHVPAPSRWTLAKAAIAPKRVTPPYSLGDMANDAVGLLDHLQVSTAHVVGMSMGGMIAQRIAIQHPDRTSSLTSIMSHTADGRSGLPTPRVLLSLLRRGQPTQSQAVDATVDLMRLVGGQDWDETEQRRRTAISVDRSYDLAGISRQALAITTATNRTTDLQAFERPTLVMHGLDDTLVRPSGGIATANAIEHSRLVLYPRMGHDIPATRHHEMVEAIVQNASRS